MNTTKNLTQLQINQLSDSNKLIELTIKKHDNQVNLSDTEKHLYKLVDVVAANYGYVLDINNIFDTDGYGFECNNTLNDSNGLNFQDKNNATCLLDEIDNINDVAYTLDIVSFKAVVTDIINNVPTPGKMIKLYNNRINSNQDITLEQCYMSNMIDRQAAILFVVCGTMSNYECNYSKSLKNLDIFYSFDAIMEYETEEIETELGLELTYGDYDVIQETVKELILNDIYLNAGFNRNDIIYMNIETGSIGNYEDWNYENENSYTVNAVDKKEVKQVIFDLTLNNWKLKD